MSCHPNRRRLLLGLSIGLVAAGALPAWARTRIDSRWLQVEVQDRDSGETLAVHTAADGQRYVAGRPGARYGVLLRNLRRERVLVVMSVDGLNVLTGQTAGWSQDGYVLGPLQAAQIAGWRKSDREIAAFEFTAPGDSYAARTGRPLDLGVIGVAVFAERRPEPPPPPTAPPLQSPSAEAQDAASAAPARRERSANIAEQKLGTGHGQREESVVTHTRFERARATPDEVVALRYDSRANLVRM
ncbi:MAG: hypothetical protein EOO24_45700, partial [Comamonadaceae bacterium]